VQAVPVPPFLLESRCCLLQHERPSHSQEGRKWKCGTKKGLHRTGFYFNVRIFSANTFDERPKRRKKEGRKGHMCNCGITELITTIRLLTQPSYTVPLTGLCLSRKIAPFDELSTSRILGRAHLRRRQRTIRDGGGSLARFPFSNSLKMALTRF